MSEQFQGRSSHGQLEKKFEPAIENTKPTQQIRNITVTGVIRDASKTIHYPKQPKIQIIKVPQRCGSNQTVCSVQGFSTLTYDDIRPKEKEESVINKIMRLFTREVDPCKCLPYQNNTCIKAKEWLGNYDVDKLKNKYSNLLESKCEPKIIKQINLDVERTHPLKNYPQKLSDLQQVLIAYSKYNKIVGYMQGMNFVAAGLIYHSDNFVAFELLRKLIDLLQMNDLYSPMSPGLSKHIQLIDYLILTKMPDLYQHFCINGVKVDMFCASWLFSLFGMMIPIQKQVKLFDCIFRYGWTYIYQLIIGFLLYHQEILMSEDMTGIICILSQQNYRIDDNELEVDWDELLDASLNVKISKTFIQEMHMRFDTKIQTFKI
ncbi:unnamed protein product [Paramecium primaurelia]|uniref:Rab-GAP TBC domain-containing protein n=1 Tax=Paramecium primaurelia TaxID=5886 RepID=A0A8S1KID5_PARPR|nr:unnamed protein product [Paramecium primaurelia]